MIINIIKHIFCPDVLTTVQKIRKTYNQYFTHFKKQAYVLDFCTVVSSSKWKFKKCVLCAVHDGLEPRYYIRSSKVALHEYAQKDKRYNLHSLYGGETTTIFRLI